MNQRMRIAAMILLAAAVPNPVTAQSTGEAIYKAKCQMCHGPDGAAATPIGTVMKITSFKTSESIKASDASYFAVTKEGKGKMPAYSGKLSDSQIKEVVSYIRTLQKCRAKPCQISLDEVGGVEKGRQLGVVQRAQETPRDQPQGRYASFRTRWLNPAKFRDLIHASEAVGWAARTPPDTTF